MEGGAGPDVRPSGDALVPVRGVVLQVVDRAGPGQASPRWCPQTPHPWWVGRHGRRGGPSRGRVG